jgi:CheY-like chemotaxis protein
MEQLGAGVRSPGKRSRSIDIAFHEGPPLKKMFAVKEADEFRIYCSQDPLKLAASLSSSSSSSNSNLAVELLEPRVVSRQPSPTPSSTLLNPLHRRVVTRDFLKSLLSETLCGGHPIKKVHTPTELGETIEVQTIGSRGESYDRTIHLEVDPDVPEVIITEKQHLQFSLQKVIDNAIKFTESGSISVRVKVGQNDEKIEVLVVDTGCGIDVVSQQNLFKPHFQQDSSISRARDGLGLSLFNAKAHIRRSLGGDVTLERSATEGPSRGSEFLIRLPMSTLDLEDDVPIVGTPPTSSHSSTRPVWGDPWSSPNLKAKSPSLGSLTSPVLSALPPTRNSVHEQPAKAFKTTSSSRKRAAFNPNLAKAYPLNILIAEDNAINRNVAIGTLTKLGYSTNNITVAFDGAEAVGRYKESLDKSPSERFDAVLMDIWMPNMDGYEATKNIKELAESVGESITTIAVTADITSESVERAKDVGMEGFLAKPYKVIDIERLIIEHFAPRCD